MLAAGAVYTPAPLAAELVEATLARALAGCTPAEARRLRILDPACGEGVLLRTALRFVGAWCEARGESGAAARRALAAGLVGVDVDAEALARARVALAAESGLAPEELTLVRGEALLEVAWGGALPDSYDVVLANPPYVDAERMSRLDPGWRRGCARRYASARGNWDLFCPFVELALRRCRAGGHVGLIVPNKLASADYARACRGLLEQEARLLVLRDRAASPGWSEQAYPLLVVAERAGPGPGPQGATGATWPIGQEEEGLVRAIERRGTPLGTIAEVWGAATVREAYALAPLVEEGEAGLRLVNSGTIDRHEHRWGRTPLRYLGASYLRPVVREPERLPPRRLAQARTPKVIVASMTLRLEAVLDARGELLAGKSTTIAWWPGRDLRLLAAQLNSRALTSYYGRVFGGERLRGGHLRVGPSQLRRLPVFDPQTADAEERARLGRIAGYVDQIAAEGPGPALLAAIDAEVEGLFGVDQSKKV